MVKKIAKFSFGWILSFAFLYIGIVQNVEWVYWTRYYFNQHKQSSV